MHKVKTQRSGKLFVKNMLILKLFYRVIIKNYKVKKLFNKFPEISGKIGINFRIMDIRICKPYSYDCLILLHLLNVWRIDRISKSVARVYQIITHLHIRILPVSGWSGRRGRCVVYTDPVVSWRLFGTKTRKMTTANLKVRPSVIWDTSAFIASYASIKTYFKIYIQRRQKNHWDYQTITTSP